MRELWLLGFWRRVSAVLERWRQPQPTIAEAHRVVNLEPEMAAAAILRARRDNKGA